jgi:hypothetical protein
MMTGMSESGATNSQEEVKKVDVARILRVMDIASILRKQREEAGKQLNIDEEKAELRKRIFNTAEATGEKLTEAEINAAIENDFSKLYSFQEPKRNFECRLAEMYTERRRIGRQYGIPALAIIALGVVISTSTVAVKSAYRASLERNAESQVEAAYQERTLIESTANEVSSSPFKQQLPKDEKTKLEAFLLASQGKIKSTDPFFIKFCSNGTAKDDINQSNMDEAKRQLIPVKETLDTAQNEVGNGKSIIETQRNLVSTRQSLDSLITQVRNMKPLEVFEQRAEVAYNNGVICIEKRQIPEVETYKAQLVNVKSDIINFSRFQGEAEKVHADIKAIAIEEQAKELGEKLYSEARQFVQAVDVQRLSQSVGKLQELDVILNQDYTIKVINKSGIKSGMDRYYTDEHGKRSSGYYLIVEALDSSGNALKKSIKSEEDGRVETVDMWGERVPESVYEAIKADKMDNGIIENNLFGRKERGYIGDVITMQGPDQKPLKRGGQITQW